MSRWQCELELKVAEIFIEDVGKGLARLDPEDVKILGAVLGDVVEIIGEKKTVARISGIFPEHLGKKIVQIDGNTRDNAGVQIGGTVQIKKAPRQTATAIVLTPLDSGNWWPDENELGYISKILQGLAVISGDKVNIPLFGGKDRFFSVDRHFAFRAGHHQPADQVQGQQTRLYRSRRTPALLTKISADWSGS